MFGISNTTEGTETTVTPISNDTLLPDFTPYFRQDESNNWQLNMQVHPDVRFEEWRTCADGLADRFISDLKIKTVGELVLRMHDSALINKRLDESSSKTRSDAMNAIAVIGERLIAEAENRGWCDEFDDIVCDVNNSLPSWLQLPVRERDYEVTWSETYYVTVQRSATVTARGEDHAMDIVSDWENADDYELKAAIDRGDYDYSSDNGDYNVEAC